MAKVKWLEGDALFTYLRLGGLKPGDRIMLDATKINRTNKKQISALRRWCEVTKVEQRVSPNIAIVSCVHPSESYKRFAVFARRILKVKPNGK